MARRPRQESASGIHHVMNRGVDHQAIFFADADRIELGRRLAAIHDEHEVTTLAYCLMGNHLHLLLRSPPGVLPDAMQHLSGVYTRHTNDRVGRDGPLFRGRYHSIPVETDAYLLRAARYIHRNPLDLPGVSSPRDYRWSSYRAYLGLRPAPVFLDVAPVMALVGGSRDALADLTEDGMTGVSAPPTLEDIRLLVACGIAVDDLTHATDEGARQWLDQTVMTLLADDDRDPRLRRELAPAQRPRSARAAAIATKRAHERFDADPAVRRVLAWVEKELGSVRSGSDPLRAAG